MKAVKKQALRFAEDLALPSFQVIVMNANVGCTDCRQRVSQLLSKMNGLLEYVVDVPNKQVILKGSLDSPSKKAERIMLLDFPNKKKGQMMSRIFTFFSSLLRRTCSIAIN